VFNAVSPRARAVSGTGVVRLSRQAVLEVNTDPSVVGQPVVRHGTPMVPVDTPSRYGRDLLGL
jgi:hypothetical protein